MATGIEMMVSALLKAVGFSREQFDGTLKTVKTEFDTMKKRAVTAEESLAALMRGQSAILKHLGLADEGPPETADTRQGVLTLDLSNLQPNAAQAEKELK